MLLIRQHVSRVTTLMTGLLTLVLFIPHDAQAFINIEAVRQEQVGDFVGKSTLKLAGQSGNTEKLSAAASSLNIHRGERDELLLLGDYAYAYSSGVRDTNNGRAHLRYTLLFRQPLAYEFFTQLEFDEFRGLNYREVAGANLRYRILQTDVRAYYAGIGAFYEHEDYIASVDRTGVRGNLYLSFVERFNERVAGSGVLYYQPSARGFEDFRVQLQTGLEVMMTSRLSLDLEYVISHDSFLPTDQVERTDMSYFAGFSLKY